MDNFTLHALYKSINPNVNVKIFKRSFKIVSHSISFGPIGQKSIFDLANLIIITQLHVARILATLD